MDSSLLGILCDPISKEDVSLSNGFLLSSERKYPVINQVPILLIDPAIQKKEGKKLENQEQKVGFSWALSHWDDLRIGELLGKASGNDQQLLNFGSGSPLEKNKMTDLGYNVISIDINAGYSGVDIIGDGHYLPIKDNVFDVVTAFEVFEHLHEPWTAIKEINRVLKLDGHFVGSVAFLKEFHSSYFHMSYWGVKKLLEYGGFEVEEIYGGQNIFSRLVHQIAPIGPARFSKGFYAIINGLIMQLRNTFWSIKHRTSAQQKQNKFDPNFNFSFSEYEKLIFAPTVLFRAKKIR